MIEIVPHGDVTCVKTATEQGGQAFFWVYSYLIGDALIDAGCANAAAEVREFASKGEIERVFVTHAHEDHYGCCSVLERHADIYAADQDIEMIKNPPRYGQLFQTVWGQPAPVSKVRVMPDSFQVNDFTFETVALPGHWPSMVGFLEPERRWLFSADAVPLPSKKKIGMPEENIPQMIHTMERLIEMDIEVLFDAHRGPITDVVPHIQSRVDHLKGLQREAKRLHEEGYSIQEIQDSLGLEGPWYMEMTEKRFGIDILLRSLLFDEAEG
ncbi:MBL fold metallo-hydrolase [Candidatus Thorarchaeota archaeon]|nr:MAG: MBL fold metallo-hydrolase [Candidatus Thorarchaeota archaeon]